MSLWTRLGHELVDIIELPDQSSDMLVSRFERYQDQIKFGAQLIVREGQVAVFVNEGKLADVFGPGTYTLETRNLPLLSTLQGWKYGFTSPFKAEVYFVSTRPVLNLQWGTQQAITMSVPNYGLATIRAYGQASYRVSDATVFFRQIVGTSSVLVTDDLHNYLRGIIVGQFAAALTESKPSLEQLQAHSADLALKLQASINTQLHPLGFELVQFVVESLSLPPAQQSELLEYSRLNNIDLGKFTQFQVAQSIGDIAKNTGGSGGGAGGIGNLGAAGMQIGVGMAAAQQVMRALNTAFPNMQPGSVTVMPPTVTTSTTAAMFHVALDGKAQGPFGVDKVAELIAAGSVTPATMVWHPGMAAWAAAGTEPGISSLFAQEPPPLPPA